MPEKKATYRINESMLRNTLLGYTVEVDAAECSAIEQEASTVRMQKAFVLPSAKALIQFVAIPLVLITTGILVYSNLDSIQAAFTPVAEPAKVEVKPKAVVTQPPIATTPSVVVNNTTPPTANEMLVKKDSVVEKKSSDSAKHQNVSKQAVPVVAGPPIDSSTSSKPVNVTKATKVDTASRRSSDPPVKKKKKKRRRSNNIDDLKESTLQPNSADDDVVVPQ